MVHIELKFEEDKKLVTRSGEGPRGRIRKQRKRVQEVSSVGKNDNGRDNIKGKEGQ